MHHHPLVTNALKFNLQLGSSLSIYGCCKRRQVGGHAAYRASLDAEQGTYIAPTLGESADMSSLSKSSETCEEAHSHHTAGVWVYIFQIIFQVILYKNSIPLVFV